MAAPPKKSSSRQTRKEVFTALGEVKEHEGKKHFVPYSPAYFRDWINRLPVGKKLAAQFSEYRSMRSNPQLRYHMVLMGYLAEHTGYTKMQIHDAMVKLKFGVTQIEVLGQKVDVRRSISESGDIENWEASELVEYDLQVCHEMGIHVPTPESLGYLPN